MTKEVFPIRRHFFFYSGAGNIVSKPKAPRFTHFAQNAAIYYIEPVCREFNRLRRADP